MNKPRAVIFDFDGTIADTFWLTADIVHKLAHLPKPESQEIGQLRHVSLMSAMQKIVPLWRVPAVLLFTRRQMFKRINEVALFAGMQQTIQELHNKGFKLYIVSANRSQNVHAFLRYHRLDSYFSGIKSVRIGILALKKRGLNKMLTASGLTAQQCVYIGNEPVDVMAAHQLGMPAIAVTWSGQDQAAFDAQRPELIADKPSQIVSFLKDRDERK